MNNKVVTTVTRTFRELGLGTIRFNYRGVGQSDGVYGDVIGEVEDLNAIVNWANDRYPNLPLILGGFSFGSAVAYSWAGQQTPKALVIIAPAVNHFDFNGLPQPQCPTLLIQGMDDEVVPADEVLQWASTLPNPLTIKQFEKTGHFFHGRLIDLRLQLTEVLQSLI